MNLRRNSLNSLFYLKKEIKSLEDEIKELTNLGSAAFSDMPKGNMVGDPTLKYVAKKLKLESELKMKLSIYINKYDELTTYINNIEDVEIRLIARLRYIENKSWNEIADYLSDDDKYIGEHAPRKKLERYFAKK